MIPHLPSYVSLIFISTTLLTVWFLYRATHQSKVVLVGILIWMGVQTTSGFTGFYLITDSVPPRFILLVGPPLLLLIGLLVTKQARAFLASLSLAQLTLLHIVRIPVELVLFRLFTNKAVPELMTFEGRNVDILSGLTAPAVYYFAFVRRNLPRSVLLLWNIVCLGLLVNIVGTAVLSAPSPFQQLAFEQPNVAIFYFPFVWLPSVIVPTVLIAHVAAFRQLQITTTPEFSPDISA